MLISRIALLNPYKLGDESSLTGMSHSIDLPNLQLLLDFH
jgi:hypothetical protein